jgi:hypothetical protein
MPPNPGYINLPHAHTIAGRLIYYLAHRQARPSSSGVDLRDLLDELEAQLRPFDSDPTLDIALQAAESAAEQARALADEIVAAGYRGDRLGQCVRNLFECLGYPEEGAARALDCGERPDSPLRP